MTDHNVSDSHLPFSLYEEGPEAFEQLPSGVLTVFPDRGFRIKWNSRFAAIWKLPLLPTDSGDTISFDELESHCREQTAEASRFQLIPSHFDPSGSDEIFRESIVLTDGRIIHRTIGTADSSDRTTLHCVYEEYSADQADLLRLQEWNDTPSSLGTEITDCDCQELWPPDAARQLTESLNAADNQPTQHNITVSTDTDGPDLSVELTVIPTTHDHASQESVLVFRDITAEQQRKREQERAGTVLAHLSRLSALGEMASNISHEINQPLTSVSNLASAARRGLRRLADAPPAIAEILDEIIEEAQRAGSIVHRLRDFARRRPVERTTLKLKECVESAVTLTSNELGVYQTGVTVAGPDDICIYADAIHIQQILVNLILNAVQAMDAANSRRRHIWVDFSVRSFTVTLTVRDTGPGFGDSMVDNPLKAYVTTKPQGTGLGLSICLSLVELNEGTLTIGDSPAGGALITLTLPATRCDAQSDQKP